MKRRVTLLAHLASAFLLLAPACADTVWWTSGAVWYEAESYEVVNHPTGPAVLLHYNNETHWYGELSAMTFMAAGERAGRMATLEAPGGARRVRALELSVIGDTPQLRVKTETGSQAVGHWSRLHFKSAPTPTPIARDDSPVERREELLISPPLLAPIVSLAGLDASIAPPEGWQQRQRADEGATWVWQWTAPAGRYEGQPPMIVLRAKPFMAGGVGGPTASLIEPMVRGAMLLSLQQREWGAAGKLEVRYVNWLGRECACLRIAATGPDGRPAYVATYGFADGDYIHSLTLLCEEPERKSLTAYLNAMFESYRP